MTERLIGRVAYPNLINSEGKHEVIVEFDEPCTFKEGQRIALHRIAENADVIGRAEVLESPSPEQQAKMDCWDLVCAGDDLTRFLMEHYPLSDIILAIQKLWRGTPARSRNRCWKEAPESLSPIMAAALAAHRSSDEAEAES